MVGLLAVFYGWDMCLKMVVVGFPELHTWEAEHHGLENSVIYPSEKF